MDGCRVGPTEALIVSKEISFPTKNGLADNGTAHRPAKAAVPVRGQLCAVCIVVTLRDHLHLRAGRTVEVRSLVGGVDLKFLNAIDGRRHHARGSATDLILDYAASRIVPEAWRIYLHAAVHVIGVLAAIEQERALVHHGASHAAVRGDAGLQSDERTGVTANRRQRL